MGFRVWILTRQCVEVKESCRVNIRCGGNSWTLLILEFGLVRETRREPGSSGHRSRRRRMIMLCKPLPHTQRHHPEVDGQHQQRGLLGAYLSLLVLIAMGDENFVVCNAYNEAYSSGGRRPYIAPRTRLSDRRKRVSVNRTRGRRVDHSRERRSGSCRSTQVEQTCWPNNLEYT